MPNQHLPSLYACPICSLEFTRRIDVLGHARRYHSRQEQNSVDWNASSLGRLCPECYLVFPTQRERARHVYLTRHFGPHAFSCSYCYQRFTNHNQLTQHMNEEHLRNYRIMASAFRGRFQYIGRTFAHHTINSMDELVDSQGAIHHSLLRSFLHRFPAIQCQFQLNVRFGKLSPEGVITEVVVMPMMTKTRRLFAGSARMIPRMLRQFYRAMESNINNALTRGSQLTFIDIVSCAFKINQVTYAGGGRRRIELPPPLRSHELSSTIDVATAENNQCIYASIAQHFLDLEPQSDQNERNKDHVYGPESRRYKLTDLWLKSGCINRLKKEGPIALEEVHKLERINKHLDLAINVYGRYSKDELELYEGDISSPKMAGGVPFIIPMVVSNRHSARNRINLLLDGNHKKSFQMHYLYISNISKLLRLDPKCDVCFRCLNSVVRDTMENHMKICSASAAQRSVMPHPDLDGNPPVVVFNPGKKKSLCPIVCYLDFETGNLPPDLNHGRDEEEEEEDEVEEWGAVNSISNINADQQEWTQLAEDEMLQRMAVGQSYTNIVAEQKPITYALLFLSGESKVLAHFLRHAESEVTLMQQLADDLHNTHKRLSPYFNDMANVYPALSPEEEEEYNNAQNCWICGGPFSDDDPGKDKVLDHEHSSLLFFDERGYMGAAHRRCNSSRQHEKKIPCFVHNLAGESDFLFLMQLRFFLLPSRL